MRATGSQALRTSQGCSRTSRARKRWTGALALVLALQSMAPASLHAAPPPSSEDTAAAESLFQDGRKLMAEKRYADACPKFAASQRLAPAVGTMLNLGDCYERLGKTASAWATFLEAASAAQRSNRPDREQTARARAAAVESRLSHLVLTVDKAAPGTVIKRDGAPVDDATIGTAVPLDPGTHELEVTAPGKKPWNAKIDVPSGMQLNVVVPELANEPLRKVARSGDIDESALDEPPPPADTSGTRRAVGFGLVGLGVAGVAAGSIFGLKANSNWSDAKGQCQSNGCSQDGVSLASDARTAGNISTVAFITGAVALVTGAVLIITAPSKRSSPPSAKAARWGLQGSF